MSTTVLADETQGTMFSGTSAYDPFKDGGGSQPYYFDSYSIDYARYRVHAVRLTITLDKPTDAGWLAIGVSPSTTEGLGLLTFDDIRGQTGFKTQRVEPTQAKTLSISAYQTTRGVFGTQYGSKERDLTAAINADPSVQYYFHVYWLRDDGGTTAATYRWRWTAYTTFYEPTPEQQN